MDQKLLDLFIKNITNKDKIYVRGLNFNIKLLVTKAKQKGIFTHSIEKELGIKKHSINWWYTQGFPLSKIEKINELYNRFLGENLLIDDISFDAKGSKAGIKIPLLNKDVAYLVGYLYGDGTLSVSRQNSRIEFYDHSKEMLIKISEILNKEFNFKDYKFMKDKRTNCFILRVNSVIVSLFFNELFGMPIGRKRNKLRIPELIKSSDYIKDFVSGFFDAEGHLYYKPGQGYRLTFSQNDGKFLEEIKEVLSLSNIPSKIVNYREGLFEIRVTRKADFYKFISNFNIRHPDKLFSVELASQGKSTIRNPRKVQ